MKTVAKVTMESNLADKYGRIVAEIARLEDERDALKAYIFSMKVEEVHGEDFILKIGTGSRSSIDQKELPLYMTDDEIRSITRVSTYDRITVRPAKEA